MILALDRYFTGRRDAAKKRHNFYFNRTVPTKDEIRKGYIPYIPHISGCVSISYNPAYNSYRIFGRQYPP